METLSPSFSAIASITISNKLPFQTHNKKYINSSNLLSLSTSLYFSLSSTSLKSTSQTVASLISPSIITENRHWMVLMETQPKLANSKSEIIDYYVKTLERVLGSEKDAQMCIYDASLDTHFGFCCDIDEQAALQLASLPGVLSVRHDPDYNSEEKDYGSSVALSKLTNPQSRTTSLFPVGSTKCWLVRTDKPGAGVITKAQVVDYYVELLTRVLGNERDAQMCIYHVSWQSNFEFCCELDEECAQELAGVFGVLSVEPDKNFESENKGVSDSSEADQTMPVRTKKLFVTGLSFYTSEKTLRAAFEGFGELVEVKIIMDKISKRSKGYAFIEYTTEEAASAALKEMNGKIINGWMIVVDVAKPSPPRNSRGRCRIAG